MFDFFSQPIYHLLSNLFLAVPDELNVPAKQDVQEVDPAGKTGKTS